MDKEKAKKMLFDVADVIEGMDLTFFLTDGVCLGAYREQGFIDTDTDIDIKMKAEDFLPKHDLLAIKFAKAGFKVNKDTPIRNLWCNMTLYLEPCHLELSSIFLIDEERWEPGKKAIVYPASLFENPEQIDFLGRKFYVPTPIIEYLKLTYGPNYMMPMTDWIRDPRVLRRMNTNIISKMVALGKEKY